jgi:hypothetical protein
MEAKNHTEPLPIPEAAVRLNVAPGTLRRWVREGAPVALRGARGRGRLTLVDVRAVTAWRHQKTAEDVLRVLAGELPALLADAVFETFTMVEGPTKRHAAGVLAGAWYVATTAAIDRIRLEVPDLAMPQVQPEKIARLRSIFAASDIMAEIFNETGTQEWIM